MPERLRNHVGFQVAFDDAVLLSRALVASLLLRWPNQRLARLVGDAARASFEVSRGMTNDVLQQFDIARVEALGLAPGGGPYRGVSRADVHWRVVGPRHLWYRVAFHDALVALGATGIAWFAENEWAPYARGKSLPY